MNSEYHVRPWMKKVLVAAGIYNLVWGTIAIVSPVNMLAMLGLNAESHALQLWQCIGMIVGVYGVGYILAAQAPFRHWVITLVGLLGKVFGPIGFVAAVLDQNLPSSMGWTILTNDIIWWAPFAMILWGAIRFHQTSGSAYAMPESDSPLFDLRSNDGRRMDEIADEKPQLVMFLRHAGCTFCRQSLSDLTKQRKRIEASGVGIVFVHLGRETEEDRAFFRQYGLDDLPRFSDPECRLYRKFGLDLGGFAQLFGLRVWIHGLIAGLLRGHGIGAAQGNSFQMPGVYLYHCGQILGGVRHDIASERPDYLALARSVTVEKATPVPV